MKCDLKGCKNKAVKALKDVSINGEITELRYYCNKHLFLAEAVNHATEHLLENWDKIMADALFFAKEVKKAARTEE